MQRSGDLFVLTLPDLSVAAMDPRTLQFFSLDEEGGRLAEATQKDTSRATNNLRLLGEFMEQPHHKFGECFRRCASIRYSPITSKYEFDVRFLTKLYEFEKAGHGGMFSSAQTEWHFLDGG